MRSDMSKVVIEKPRRQSKWDYGGKGRKAEHILSDDAPKREPMSLGRGTKQQTDVLGPLVGYLRKHVGKPWNKVNADIHEHLKMTSMAQGHILDHIDHMVVKDVILVKEGKREVPYTSDGRYEIRTSNDKWRTHHGFYVCPKSGLLKLSPVRNYRGYRNRPRPVKKIGERTFKEQDGIWYEIWLDAKPVIEEPHLIRVYGMGAFDPEYLKKCGIDPRKAGHHAGRRWSYCEDVWFNCNGIQVDSWEAYGKADVYCVRKQQLNSREIDKLGLRKKESPLPNLVRRRKKRR